MIGRALLILGLGGCFQPAFSDQPRCGPGDRCPDGSTCHADVCLSDTLRCGDAVVTALLGEVCDDGNTRAGDGCNADCKSDETCGNGFMDPGETCDDGDQISGDGCSNVCRSEACGNGILDVGEVCDDFNTIDGDGCRGDCKSSEGCGNGMVDLNLDTVPPVLEECDDGNTSNEDACVQIGGTRCLKARCGDGLTNLLPGAEECDDGNIATETACPYGTASCVICDSACRIQPATGDVCGDGAVAAVFESCDDGNALACGSCSADCHEVTSAVAFGVMFPASGADLTNGDTFVIDDGIDPPTTFELTNGTPAAGSIKIAFLAGDSNLAMRNKLVAAINGVGAGLLVTASAGSGTLVELRHDRPTTLGNVALVETVATPNFQVFGMAGGAGGDCPGGTPCAGPQDCASNVCTEGTCQ